MTFPLPLSCKRYVSVGPFPGSCDHLDEIGPVLLIFVWLHCRTCTLRYQCPRASKTAGTLTSYCGIYDEHPLRVMGRLVHGMLVQI